MRTGPPVSYRTFRCQASWQQEIKLLLFAMVLRWCLYLFVAPSPYLKGKSNGLLNKYGESSIAPRLLLVQREKETALNWQIRKTPSVWCVHLTKTHRSTNQQSSFI